MIPTSSIHSGEMAVSAYVLEYPFSTKLSVLLSVRNNKNDRSTSVDNNYVVAKSRELNKG